MLGGEELASRSSGLYPGCCFSPFPLFFLFWNVNINFMEGPGLCSHRVLIAHSCLRGEERRKTEGQGWSAQKAPRTRRGGRGAQEAVEGYLILNLLFFFNVETFRHKPAPVFKSLKHL